MKFKRISNSAAVVLLLALIMWVFVAYWTSNNESDRYNSISINPLRAIVSCEYGVESLQLGDLEKPMLTGLVAIAGVSALQGLRDKVCPVIDRTYKLEQTQDAVRYMEGGHARGKVVIVME